MGMKPQQYAVIRDAAKLRAQRRTVGKTLRQVARDVGRPTGYSFLHGLETRRRTTCTPEFAWRLAIALQIPPHSFDDYFELHGVDARVA